MRQDAHNHHEPFWRRWRHRNDQPPSTPWTRFREEHPVQSPQHTGGMLRVNPLRIKGFALMMRTPQVTIGSFHSWMQARAGTPNPPTPLPPVRDTGAIRPVQADTQYTLLPDRFRSSGLPRLLPEERKEVFSQLDTMPQKHTGEIDQIPTLHGVEEDQMPGWGEQDRAELFADVRQPSRPLEDDEPTVEHERTKRNKLWKAAITGLLGQAESE